MERAAAASQTDVLLEALDALGTVQAERGGWDETVVTQRRDVDEADRAGESRGVGAAATGSRSHSVMSARRTKRTRPRSTPRRWRARRRRSSLEETSTSCSPGRPRSPDSSSQRTTSCCSAARGSPPWTSGLALRSSSSWAWTDEALQALAEAAAAADTGPAKASILRERARLQLELGSTKPHARHPARNCADTRVGRRGSRRGVPRARADRGGGRSLRRRHRGARARALKCDPQWLAQVQVVVRERLSSRPASTGPRRPAITPPERAGSRHRRAASWTAQFAVGFSRWRMPPGRRSRARRSSRCWARSMPSRRPPSAFRQP